MENILITAFEPFGGRQSNTSGEVLRMLPEHIGGCRVKKMLLPVVFGLAAKQVLKEAADAVFLLGEAGGRNTVTPEIQAVNRREARICDNEGNQPRGEEIISGGPARYLTGVPVRHIVKRMQEEGCSINASEDAGNYVCNDTFYSVGLGRPEPVVFIHCPAETDGAAEYAETVRRFIEIAVSGE